MAPLDPPLLRNHLDHSRSSIRVVYCFGFYSPPIQAHVCIYMTLYAAFSCNRSCCLAILWIDYLDTIDISRTAFPGQNLVISRKAVVVLSKFPKTLRVLNLVFPESGGWAE